MAGCVSQGIKIFTPEEMKVRAEEQKKKDEQRKQVSKPISCSDC